MAPKKERRPRAKRVIGREPVLLSSLELDTKDESIEDRVDGYTDRGEVRPPRKRERHAEPLPLSHAEFGVLFASMEFGWKFAEVCDQILAESRGPGRPAECGVADVLVFHVLLSELKSTRAVARFVADRANWSRIVLAAETAFPTTPRRRLRGKPPTRFQYMRMRKSLQQRIPDFDERLRAGIRHESVRAVAHMGFMCESDSFTHPAKTKIVVGDATWEQSHFNGVKGATYVDRSTGEICERRFDPDAKPFHHHGSAPGNYIVSAMVRSDHPHEQVILDAQYKPDGISDGTVFADMALELFNYLPDVRGAGYDMALKAADADRIGATGRHVIEKLPKTKKGRAQSRVVGEQIFQGSTLKFKEVITAVDGCPTITVKNLSGDGYVVPLVRKQSKLRDSTMYNIYEIPSHPIVPRSKQGATVMIRMFSSKTDIENNNRRPNYLRSIPNNDSDFDRLFGLRETTESMHHNYKSRLPNRRARSVGLARREFDFRGFQLHQLASALAAWHIRTGCDVSDFLGHWRPPERLTRSLAA